MTTTKSGKITTLYADGVPIGTIRDGSDGGGAGTITEVSINGQTVATSGVANIPAATSSVMGAVMLGSEAGKAAEGNHTHSYAAITNAPTFRLDGTDLYITQE